MKVIIIIARRQVTMEYDESRALKWMLYTLGTVW